MLLIGYLAHATNFTHLSLDFAECYFQTRIIYALYDGEGLFLPWVVM